MKKSFPLTGSNHKPARVIELIHRDVQKYIKRERRKPLPEGTDFWDFECRVGGDSEFAENVHVAAISKAIDEAAARTETTVYVEILAKPGHRTSKKKATKSMPAEESASSTDPLS